MEAPYLFPALITAGTVVWLAWSQRKTLPCPPANGVTADAPTNCPRLTVATGNNGERIMSDAIDWSKPVETLDGIALRLAAMAPQNPDKSGDRFLEPANGDLTLEPSRVTHFWPMIVKPDGSEWYHGTPGTPVVRNVAMTDELPPVRFLDAAAKAAGRGGWDASDHPYHSQRLVKSIIAHARTLQQLAKYERPPVDEAELKRRQDAREFAAQGYDQLSENEGISADAAHYDALAALCREGERDTDKVIFVIYKYACHRDNVAPVPVEEWGK